MKIPKPSTLEASLLRISVTLSEAAKTTFASSTSKVEICDTSGIKSTPTLEGRELLCLYYTLLRSADNVPLDISVVLGVNAQVLLRYGIVVGLQEPGPSKEALLLCADIEVSSVANMSSSAAAATALRGATTTIGGTATMVVDTSARSAHSGDNGSGGLSTEAKSTIGVAIPSSIATTITVIG